MESLGFTSNIRAWFQQRPSGLPYTFDVQAIIGRSWSSGDHNRLIRRINAAQSERDRATITIVHETSQGLRLAAAVHPGLSIQDDSQPGALPDVQLHSTAFFSSAAHTPLTDGELQLEGVLPEFGLAARLNSAGFARHFTINDYDLRAQP